MTLDWEAATLRVSADPRVQWRTLDDDLVLYHPVTDEVSHLDAIGTQVWNRLASAVAVQDLVSSLAVDFGVDRSVVAHDVTTLLAELLSAQLIQLS